MLPDKAPLRLWRRRLNLTQVEAAKVLELSRRQIQYYDTGEEPLPRVVELAMMAVEDRPEIVAHAR